MLYYFGNNKGQIKFHIWNIKMMLSSSTLTSNVPTHSHYQSWWQFVKSNSVAMFKWLIIFLRYFNLRVCDLLASLDFPSISRSIHHHHHHHHIVPSLDHDCTSYIIKTLSFLKFRTTTSTFSKVSCKMQTLNTIWTELKQTYHFTR